MGGWVVSGNTARPARGAGDHVAEIEQADRRRLLLDEGEGLAGVTRRRQAPGHHRP